MQYIRTLSEAVGTRKRLELAYKTDFFLPDRDGGVQGFLVEQHPGITVRPHFHAEYQFQVVVAGSGTMGRHSVPLTTVHYTDPYSPYGPILAGTEGLSYFTLRVRYDPGGAQWMPESRKNKIKKTGRNVSVHFAPGQARNSPCEALLGLQPDGLAVYGVRLLAGEQIDAPDPQSGGGQYYVVVRGSLRVDGRDLEAMSCIFRSPDDGASNITAGSAGLEVLVLQYPKQA